MRHYHEQCIGLTVARQESMINGRQAGHLVKQANRSVRRSTVVDGECCSACLERF